MMRSLVAYMGERLAFLTSAGEAGGVKGGSEDSPPGTLTVRLGMRWIADRMSGMRVNTRREER